MKFSVVAVVVAALFVCAQCQMKTGMRAPQLVYSCTVENQFSGPVEVEVRYSHPFENRMVVDRATLAHGESKFFGRRDFQTVDKTTFAAVVADVTVKDVADPSHEMTLTKNDFKISSPTVDYKIRVVETATRSGFDLQHATLL